MVDSFKKWSTFDVKINTVDNVKWQHNITTCDRTKLCKRCIPDSAMVVWSVVMKNYSPLLFSQGRCFGVSVANYHVSTSAAAPHATTSCPHVTSCWGGLLVEWIEALLLIPQKLVSFILHKHWKILYLFGRITSGCMFAFLCFCSC